MINQGSKARTDSGDSGGIALSGGIWSTCEGRKIPTTPNPPDADFGEVLSERIARRNKSLSYVLRLADAYRDRSERARVLLANYNHVCRELGIGWQS